MLNIFALQDYNIPEFESHGKYEGRMLETTTWDDEQEDLINSTIRKSPMPHLPRPHGLTSDNKAIQEFNKVCFSKLWRFNVSIDLL